MAKARRNPGISWGSPIQEQTPRQQARFLVLVEQAAAILKGFTPGCSVAANPITRTVLEVGGVPLELLDPSAGFNYLDVLDQLLKTPWKENRKHPHFAVMDCTKDALLRLRVKAGTLNHFKDGPYSDASEKRLSQETKYLLDGRLPSVTLAYRHLIADYAKALVGSGGNLKEAGLWLDPASLAAIELAAVPVLVEIEKELAAIRAKRRAEYAERFGHQPSTGTDNSELLQSSYEALGMTMEEWFAKNLGQRFATRSGDGISDNPGASSPADYLALGISHDATEADIQAAFRKLVKRHHPDAGGNSVEFQVVANAYNRLRGVAR